MEVKWYFVFKSAENSLTRKLTPEGFGHVFAVTQLENICVMIEPLLGAVNHLLVQRNIDDLLEVFAERGYTVIGIVMETEPNKFRMRGPIMTCASYLAYTVGLDFWGFTPMQLYRKLMKKGGMKIC